MWNFRRQHGLTFTRYGHEVFLNRCWMLGEAELRSGWLASQAGREGDLCAIAQGRLKPVRMAVGTWACELVERNPLGDVAWSGATLQPF